MAGELPRPSCGFLLECDAKAAIKVVHPQCHGAALEAVYVDKDLGGLAVCAGDRGKGRGVWSFNLEFYDSRICVNFNRELPVFLGYGEISSHETRCPGKAAGPAGGKADISAEPARLDSGDYDAEIVEGEPGQKDDKNGRNRGEWIQKGPSYNSSPMYFSSTF